MTDFVVSCRVFQRGVEEAILAHAVALCCKMGMKRLTAIYHPTDKNKPCLEFWRRSGFSVNSNDGYTFMWDLANTYDPPTHIKIEY